MKVFVCFLLLCVVLHVTDAHRRLQGSARAVAYSTGGSAVASARSSGDSEVSAVSVANNCGKATTVAVGSEGAKVDGTTIVDSDKCTKNEATTVVKGEGEKGDASVTTIVKSNTPVDVSVFLQKFKDGSKAAKIAIDIVAEYENYSDDYGRVVASLVELAADEDTYPLFVECILLLLKNKGCEGFRAIFSDHENALVAIVIPDEVSTCIYPKCASLSDAKFCCGKAQLEQDYCACKDGKCDWKAPEEQNGLVPYWICNDCGYEAPICTCP